MKLIRLCLFIVFGLFIACGPTADYQTKYQKNGTYPISGGECKEPVATVVMDRNDIFEVSAAMGSASSVEGRPGLFWTVKHVVDQDVKYKIFFCGRMYNAERVLPKVITDTAFIRMVTDFDSSQFPKSYPIASMVNVGDRIFVRGIHPHPNNMQQNKILHNIIHKYYGLANANSEFVYDDLAGKVVAFHTPPYWKEEENSNKINERVAQEFTKIITDDDHKVPSGFHGLSGGPVVNEKGEIVGLVSNGPPDSGETVWDENGIHRIPYKIILLISTDEMKRALTSLDVQ